MNRRVRLADEGREIVDHVAGGNTLVAPVPRQADMVHHAVFQVKRPNAAGYQRFGPDRAARRRDDHLLCVGDADLAILNTCHIREKAAEKARESWQGKLKCAITVQLSEEGRVPLRFVRKGDERFFDVGA